MKILVVHEVSWFNKVVYEIHDIPELLSLKGHGVYFLEFEEHDSRARWSSVISAESKAHAGSKVSVISPPHLFSGTLRRLMAVGIQPLVFIRLIKKINPDIVVTYSIPTSGWQIVAICKRKRVPIMVRAIDVSHKLRKTRFEFAIMCAESFVYKHADHVCANNEVLRQYCIGLGASSAKSSVIYPGSDTQRFYPAPPRSDLQLKLGIQPHDKVIVFMGTLFRFSGLVELLTELAPALRNDRSLIFLILGDGEEFDRLQQLARSLEMGNQVLLTGRIEYDQLADYIRLGQVAVVPFRPELVTHGALPGKVLQYLACGLPTVSTPLHGLQSMVAEGDGVLYADSSREMVDKAVQLVNNSQHRDQVAIRGLDLINQHCNWETQIQKFEGLLESLVHDR